jgi:hypothetical protein
MRWFVPAIGPLPSTVTVLSCFTFTGSPGRADSVAYGFTFAQPTGQAVKRPRNGTSPPNDREVVERRQSWWQYATS